MSPDEAREGLREFLQDSGDTLAIEGWYEPATPTVGSCGEDGVNWSYLWAAPPQPNADHAANAKVVKQYWESLGLGVRAPEGRAVLFGTGGGDSVIASISFSTEPGEYYFSATSICVPGDALEIMQQEQDG